MIDYRTIANTVLVTHKPCVALLKPTASFTADLLLQTSLLARALLSIANGEVAINCNAMQTIGSANVWHKPPDMKKMVDDCL